MFSPTSTSYEMHQRNCIKFSHDRFSCLKWRFTTELTLQSFNCMVRNSYPDKTITVQGLWQYSKDSVCDQTNMQLVYRKTHFLIQDLPLTLKD